MTDGPVFISASRRTDIPAWYTPWFLNRVRAGFCRVRNPFRPSQVRDVSLTPERVAGIFFWTRWPGPLLPYLDELEASGYRSVFHVTVTGLPAPLEPHPVSEERRLESILELSRRVGRGRVWWRYDPIVLGSGLDGDYHLRQLERLASILAPATGRVTLSLLDWYRKTERRMGRLAVGSGAGGASTGSAGTGAFLGPGDEGPGGFSRAVGHEPEVIELVGRLATVARKHGIVPVSCCEPAWAGTGVEPGACIDAEAFFDLFHHGHPTGRDPGQRPHCRCSPSIDIGAVDSCIAGCVYCYSTRSHEAAAEACRQHSPEAPGLW